MTTAFERSEKTGREPAGRVRRTALPKAGRNKEIKRQVKALEKLRLPELQARFAEIVGEETKAPNRKFLVRRITEALEAQAGAAPPAEAAPKPAKKKRGKAKPAKEVTKQAAETVASGCATSRSRSCRPATSRRWDGPRAAPTRVM